MACVEVLLDVSRNAGVLGGFGGGAGLEVGRSFGRLRHSRFVADRDARKGIDKGRVYYADMYVPARPRVEGRVKCQGRIESESRGELG